MGRDCAAARALLAARLDGGELDATGRATLDAHLRGCPACRMLAHELAAEGRALADLWPEVVAPAGFLGRVVASLPPRRAAPPWRRPALAAAIFLAVLAGGLLSRGEVRAEIDLALRRVGLREVAPSAQVAPPPPREVTLAEARALVPWPLRQPDPAPAGYRLARVSVGAVYTFAEGPVVFLFYQREGATVPQLVVTEFRATGSGPIDAPIATGAGRRVPVGDGSGLFIDGMWVARDGGQVWERGTLVRLLVEEGDRVVQFDADPRAGWDAATLAALAETVR